MRMPTDSDGSALADAFLDHVVRDDAACAGVVREIHGADEMFAYLRRAPGLAPRARFEYFRSGYEAFRVLRHVARLAGRDLDRVGSVLDFACGRGRVARFLAKEVRGEFWAADIDGDATAFVASRFGSRSFVSTADPDELRFPRAFDVIYVGSLFSHLPRASFRAWLGALARALTPDGILVFSTHGPRHVDAAARDASGFTFVPESETLRLEAQAYGSAYVEVELVHRLAREAGLAPLATAPDDLWSSQDLHVAGRAEFVAPDGLSTWTASPVPRGSVDRLERSDAPRAGWVWIGGTVRGSGRGSDRDACAVEEVRVLVDGFPPITAELGARAERDRREWYTEGDASALLDRPRVALIEARTAGGERMVVDAVELA